MRVIRKITSRMAISLLSRGMNFSQIRYFQKTANIAFKNACSGQGSMRPFSCIKINPILKKQFKLFEHIHHSQVRNLVINSSSLLKNSKGFSPFIVRCMSRGNTSDDKKSTLIYICAVGIFMLGMSYAGVPLYRMFCQATGLGGQATQGHDNSKVESMEPVKNRIIKVKFNADVASSMRWNFRPQQTEVKVAPGETALAFYQAKNPTNKPIIGISTYNVVPFEAGQYFNKIQCFCFEEQILNPHEEVDMPVFFFIDPEYAEDPKLEHIDTIMLSYTFFEAKEGLELPLPGFATS